MSTSQTLSRGLSALEYIALADAAPNIEGVADHLGVHRSVAYRIVRTLEEHHLVGRDAAGACRPGIRLAALGRFARPTLQSIALTELPQLANDLSMTCFLVVRDGDEALTLESLEPTTSQFHISYRPGIRHAIDQGAPGIAILSESAPTPGERAEVSEARVRGWAMTTGEVVPGSTAIAVPIAGADASIATVFFAGAEIDTDAVAAQLTTTALTIARHIERSHLVAASATEPRLHR